MSPHSRGLKKLVSSFSSSSNSSQHICLSCRNTLSRRNYASAATAEAQNTVQAPTSEQAVTDAPPFPQPSFAVRAGIVLSRPPLITPEPHPFEKAYYLYQRRLNERLVLPFTQYFYFKRGTPAFAHWRAKRSERGGSAARDIGKYNAYGKEAWNDEVLVGDQSADPQRIIEQLIEEEGRASELVAEKEDLKTAGLRRVTEADTNNDLRSLERSLCRTLYLLVKSKGREEQKESTLWSFPNGSLEGKESIKEAAQRILGLSCGVHMNTWFVGNHPVGLYTSGFLSGKDAPAQEEDKTQETKIVDEPQKTFFMKARIMAGQTNVKDASGDFEDFRWLAKEEIQRIVHPNYWSKVKNMLVDQ